MAYLPEALSEEEVKKTPVAEIRKGYTKIANVYTRIRNHDYMLCHKCGEQLAADGFYKNSNYATGYFPICTRCLAKMATDYDSKTNMYVDNKQKTMETLRFMNLPFIESLYNSALSTQQNAVGERGYTSGWRQMMIMLSSLPQYKGKTWKDSEYSDETVLEEVDERRPRADIKKIFGSGFSESDYLYLQDQYDDWRTRTQVDSKSQETYIVRICFKLLDIWKAQKAGRDTKDLDRSLNDLMAAANLQPKQNVANAATDSLSFSQLIERWEMEEPIPEPDPEFKDVDGVGKYIRTWFAGHLAKAVGLKNAYTTEYEEEMAKYTVNKPEFNEAEGGSPSSTYDKLFGSSGDKDE